LRRLKGILNDVDERAKNVRKDLRRHLGLFSLDVRRVIVFASPPSEDRRPAIRLTVDHCNPQHVEGWILHKKMIALPVGRFKRLIREIVSRTREGPLELPHVVSVDQFVYEEMRKVWNVWVVRVFGKRRGKSLQDAIC
jgi:hypothetical protein